MKQEKNGFSPEKEEKFLKRLPDEIRRVNLDQELKTQLAEDFGLVEFTLKYRFDEEGNIVDLRSKEKVLGMISRGGVAEEMEGFKQIEDGLKKNPQQTWVYFSPENKKLNYPTNCVDFWRVVNGEVVWNRMVVKNNFEEMNETRQFLSGKEKVKDEMEILKSPVAVNLKLAEVFDFFRLNETKNITNLENIEKVVKKYLNEFEENFGEELTKKSDLIFRLYSVCFTALKNGEKENFISERDLESYMYGIMKEVSVEKSFGCAAETRIGAFGERIGYFINSDGTVIYGKIPEGFKECKKCGCWYTGDSCPFC